MAHIQDLEDAGYRIVFNDAGAVSKIVGSRGEPSPFVLAETNPVTGGIELSGIPSINFTKSAAGIIAGRRNWPTGGHTGRWRGTYNRIPEYWVANRYVKAGTRRIVSHSSVPAGSDIPFDQESTVSSTRYFVMTCVVTGLTASSKPSVSGETTTPIIDGTAQWISASVIFVDNVGGLDGNNGNSPSAPQQTAANRGSGRLMLFKCGVTYTSATINTAGKTTISANGITAINQVSWYGDFATGVPVMPWYLTAPDWEFFQINFSLCTGLNNARLAFYGCNFQSELVVDWTTSGEYGYCVIEDCAASLHTATDKRGVAMTIRSGAALDRLIMRNLSANGNHSYGYYLGIGVSGNYTTGAAGVIRYFEHENCQFNSNGKLGVFVENLACVPQPANRVQKSRIIHNEYKNNSGHACTYGGFGNISDADYLNVFALNEVGQNNFGVGNGTGNAQLTGWYRGIAEYNKIDCSGAGQNSFDGVGLYLDVVSIGTDTIYTTAGGCFDVVVRYNLVTGQGAVKWQDSSSGGQLPIDRLGTPASQGIALYKTLKASVYGNIVTNSGIGILTSMSHGVDINSNMIYGCDEGILIARDAGGNRIRDNEISSVMIGVDQSDVRMVSVPGGSTFTLSSDANNVWNVMNIACTSGVLTDLCMVVETNGEGIGCVMHGSGATSSKLCILVPFSKTSYSVGELLLAYHLNLSTNQRAVGSISNNKMTAVYGAVDVGLAQGTSGWVSNANYANGLLSNI